MPFTIIDPELAEIAPVTTAGAPKVDWGTPFIDMKEAITENHRGRADISTRLPRWINDSYRLLASWLDLNELYSSMTYDLLADQPLYTLPKAVAWVKWFGSVDAVNYLDGGRGFEMTDLQSYRMLPESTATSVWCEPYKYFRIGRTLVIWPTPTTDTTATMDFRIRPEDLVNDADCPILPPEFHPIIQDMAEAMAFRKLGARSEGDRVWNDAISNLRPILNTDAEEKDSMHMSLQPIRSRSQLYRGGR